MGTSPFSTSTVSCLTLLYGIMSYGGNGTAFKSNSNISLTKKMTAIDLSSIYGFVRDALNPSFSACVWVTCSLLCFRHYSRSGGTGNNKDATLWESLVFARDERLTNLHKIRDTNSILVTKIILIKCSNGIYDSRKKSNLFLVVYCTTH